MFYDGFMLQNNQRIGFFYAVLVYLGTSIWGLKMISRKKERVNPSGYNKIQSVVAHFEANFGAFWPFHGPGGAPGDPIFFSYYYFLESPPKITPIRTLPQVILNFFKVLK